MIHSTDKGLTASVRTAALWLIGGTVVLYCVTYIAWRLGMDPSVLFGMTDRAYGAIEPVRWSLALARVAVVILMWCYWSALVARWFPPDLQGYISKRAVWMALRHKLLVVFLFMEACIHISYLGRLGLWA